MLVQKISGHFSPTKIKAFLILNATPTAAGLGNVSHRATGRVYTILEKLENAALFLRFDYLH